MTKEQDLGNKEKSREPKEPQFDLTITETPARRLQNVINKAGYTNAGEFIVKALDVFEASLDANGKAVVENKKANLRYIFNVANPQPRKGK